MSARWTLDDIAWDRFEAAKVTPDLLAVVKTASLVEANSADYVTYLCNVFHDDETFKAAVVQWGEEEAQHGAALGRWAEMADPSFSFAESLAYFRAGYSLPLDVSASVRGSRVGELIARCVVETGTSSFYSAIRDASAEPVLKDIGKRIATDEFFHYQLFEKHLKRYERDGKMPVWSRLKVALGRVQEAEDDELAYAYYSANIAFTAPETAYENKLFAQTYWRQAMGLYREPHVDNAARMILRAAALNPNGWLGNTAAKTAWKFVQWRQDRLNRAA
ncbi:ferritin-like domain-containing protein [Govanella unica]|uniref:Ferritin-like domain-containing protein n=1 Tax=Govanella unica TaxID=2975056 RepID=A0A9X3TW17_9PROT|nr:ferritin-like domain-containing protein [Govania unica]MDA5192761.1 ferritin-like domain-containing protein [Govania unica]